VNKTAFVTGFTGQDGTFLTRHLLDQGYRVIALVRRISTEPPRRTRGKFDFSDEIERKMLVLEEGDLLSPSSLNRIIGSWQPDEVYNLAAQSHVGLSFGQPEFTIDSILDGTINLITALEHCHTGEWKMYQASTSEMYGHRDQGETFTEQSHFNPNSPYAIAKFAAHQYCVMKRNQGRFISCGILFNHESEIRGGDFVTQKIARGAVHFASTGEPIHLGNLDAKRDWGYAGDYVKGMHLMLQQDRPDDFVLATGETRSIRDFVDAAFSHLGFKLESNGHEGPAERLIIIDGARGGTAVVVDEAFFRPNDVGYLIGDYSKAKEILGWQPEHKFDLIVKIMVDAAQDGLGYER
jgi:GDPmannose 4,6-dehydratase